MLGAHQNTAVKLDERSLEDILSTSWRDLGIQHFPTKRLTETASGCCRCADADSQRRHFSRDQRLTGAPVRRRRSIPAAAIDTPRAGLSDAPTGWMTLRSSSRVVAFFAAVAALVALAPFTTPVTDRPPEVAASPSVAVETDPGAPAFGSPDDGSPDDDDVDEPSVSADTESGGIMSDGFMSDDAQLDVVRDLVADPKLLSAGATIQRQLVDHGWTVTVDGTIGARTRRAIAEFQHANGLPPTGNVDSETDIRLSSPDPNGYQHYLANPLPVSPPSGTPLPAADPMIRIEQIADSVGFDWRSRGVSFVMDCHPTHQRCATGSYYTSTRQIFITRSILNDTEQLRSVVLHELAHAWQFIDRGWPEAGNDVSAWGRTGIDGLEAAADCLATAWGATRTYYWSCPADARGHMLLLYQDR